MQSDAREIVASSAIVGVSAENTLLGYRLTLPDGYRRSASVHLADGSPLIGRDTYTTLSESQQRAHCLSDHNGTPSTNAAANLDVEVYRSSDSITAAAWGRSAPQRSQRETVEAVVIGGLDGARFIEDGRTSAYVIRTNDRIYFLTPVVRPSQHRLDAIAATFIAITPQPAPVKNRPSASAADAARELATALTVRDTDAVARVIGPCVLAISATIDGRFQGGVLNRAVGTYIEELRARFATGRLTVAVDPQLQRQTRRDGPERLFIRTIWTDVGSTTNIDLVFTPTLDGGWLWTQATPHLRSADLRRGCLPYGSPWVSGASSC